jgi:hypothetical protein
MKKLLLPILLLISFALPLRAQMIDNFDAASTDTTYQLSFEETSSMVVTDNTADKMEGAGSLSIRAVIGAIWPWGSYAQLIKRIPDGEPLMDWTINSELRIWIKVLEAPAIPANMVFRIHIADRIEEDGSIEEYIYENATVLDAVGDWYQLVVPLVERETDGYVIPNDEGFVRFPLSWGGGQYNNNQLDWDKIVGYNISAITSGYVAPDNLPADSLTFLIDGFERAGMKSVPAIIFNGIALPGTISSWAWGQSSLEVVEGAGPVPNTNALKWTQGDEWGNGWTGMGFTIDPPFNLAGSWQQDSVKFKLKAEEGVDTLRIQFEGGSGKVGSIFIPIADNQWHEYSLPLREMVYQDGTTGFDSSSVHVVGMMAEATGVAGKVVYITDWWTGNPVFDVIPPDAPTGVNVTAGTYSNLVWWTDVAGEDQEKYNIYYSTEPITDFTTADVVRLGVVENEGAIEHVLRAPNTDQSVTFYYAVTCVDAAGNESAAAFYNTPTENTAKGVPTISLTVPSTFTADGDLSEWSVITPFSIKLSEGTGFAVANQPIDNDQDLSALAYVALDNEFLYVAFDVEDDAINVDTTRATYLNDAPDIFLGLYNWHGKPHTSYKRGETPDYQIRFAQNKMILEGAGDMFYPGDNYSWEEKFPTGYTVEAKVPLQMLADMRGDVLFVPVEGYRIPIDFSFNDADAGEREGILTYSQFNEDKSYQDPSRWSYTWIGNLMEPVGVNDEYTPLTYSLSQNYPNPFNPETKIVYSLKNDGNVSLKIYDILGREIVTLVNQYQNAGTYNVSFNAASLSSGMYFYKIESGSFTSVKKMMLLK